MGFVSQRLMVYAERVEIAVNGTVVHRSGAGTWRTYATDCLTDARSHISQLLENPISSKHTFKRKLKARLLNELYFEY